MDYPFSKYDYILLPQMNCDAMENAGIVTMSEDYVFEEEVEKETRCSLVVLISHEVCHMWFGNLVTMKWWDDLWLNESLADFMSYYSLDQFIITFDSFDYQARFNR